MDSNPSERTVVIEANNGWQLLDFKELAEYRDLFFFLVWRQIKVMYAQTILGFGWAILNPFIQIIIFSVIFGKVARIDTDGIPYVLFSTVAIVPWTYMSQAMTLSSQSLVSGQAMLGKVYFPRALFPITPVLAKLVDFTISLVLVVAVMVYFQVSLTWNLLWLPLFLAMMVFFPAAAGFWLSALAIRYRDVKFAMPFVINLLIYSAPILYTASAIAPEYRFFYSLNPIVTVIEGFRATLLGLPMPWEFIIPGIVVGTVMLIGGILYFKKMEKVFVDVI